MNRILAALDVETADEARSLATTLRGAVGGFKIGKRLFTSCGPDIVRELVDQGDRVFLDLKFHDIPSTVAGAIAASTGLGVWMVNVHASGGSAMMRAARAAADEEAARRSKPAPLLIGVTVLTSFDQNALDEIGVTSDVPSQVERLAALAHAAQLDGVVASPREIQIVRKRTSKNFAIVTPGIRGANDPKDDQQRTLTAAEALTAGADYLVVGRPIIAAPDPRRAAEAILAECGGAPLL